MHKTISVIVCSVLFLFVALSLVSGDFILPYSFAGTVYDEDGELAQDVKITITNRRTNDQLNYVTNSNGEYQLSASSFISGYKDGDICDYVVIHNNIIKVMLIKIDTTKGGTVIDFNFGVEEVQTKKGAENIDDLVVVPSISSLFFVFALVVAYLFKKQK